MALSVLVDPTTEALKRALLQHALMLSEPELLEEFTADVVLDVVALLERHAAGTLRHGASTTAASSSQALIGQGLFVLAEWLERAGGAASPAALGQVASRATRLVRFYLAKLAFPSSPLHGLCLLLLGRLVPVERNASKALLVRMLSNLVEQRPHDLLAGGRFAIALRSVSALLHESVSGDDEQLAGTAAALLAVHHRASTGDEQLPPVEHLVAYYDVFRSVSLASSAGRAATVTGVCLQVANHPERHALQRGAAFFALVGCLSALPAPPPDLDRSGVDAVFERLCAELGDSAAAVLLLARALLPPAGYAVAPAQLERLADYVFDELMDLAGVLADCDAADATALTERSRKLLAGRSRQLIARLTAVVRSTPLFQHLGQTASATDDAGCRYLQRIAAAAGRLFDLCCGYYGRRWSTPAPSSTTNSGGDAVASLLQSCYVAVTLMLKHVPLTTPLHGQLVLDVYAALFPFQIASDDAARILAAAKALLARHCRPFFAERLSPALADSAQQHRACFYLRLLYRAPEPLLAALPRDFHAAQLWPYLFDALASPQVLLCSAAHGVFAALFAAATDELVDRRTREQLFVLYVRLALEHYPAATPALSLSLVVDAFMLRALRRDPVVLLLVDALVAKLAALFAAPVNKQQSLLADVFFRLLLLVDVAMLPHVLSAAESLLRSAPLDLRELLLRRVYRLLSTNYDQTRKAQLVAWYASVSGAHRALLARLDDDDDDAAAAADVQLK